MIAVAATAMLAAASFRLQAFTGFLLATYVVAVGEIVLLTEALSLVDGVSAPGYAIGESCLLVVSILVWNRRGRPTPRRPSVSMQALRNHPLLLLLVGLVALSLTYQAFLALVTPPNNYDSLAYHLPRAVEWYQRGSVDYYPAHSDSVNAPQPNAEMLIVHGFTFARSDILASLPQLLAEVACMIAIFGIAIRLGAPRAAAAYAALLVATLPQIILQSVTTQNDLLTASFLSSAVYFCLGRTRRELALAGVAVGLALGTKATAFIALPLLLLAVLIAHDRRNLIRAAAFASAGFAVVGAHGYILNVAHTGRALGASDALGPLLRPEPSVGGTISTAARVSWNFLDLSGYPISGSTLQPIERGGAWFFHVAHIPLNPEDSTVLAPQKIATPFVFTVNTRVEETLSYFGPLGVLLFLLSLAFILAVALRRARPGYLVPALAIPLFVLGVAISTRYNDFNGRYLIPAVVLTMPLVAVLYRNRGVAAAIAVIGALTLPLVHLSTENKPSGARDLPAVWTMTRARAQAVKDVNIMYVIESVERRVPADGRLGYVLDYNDWVYPLYGTRLERHLVKLPRHGMLRAAEHKNVDAIVISSIVRERAKNWNAVRFPRAGWTVLVPREQPFEPVSDPTLVGRAE